MFKRIQVQLYPPGRPHWHGDIKKHWRCSGVFIVSFEKIPQLFLVFHFWICGSVAGCVYKQRSTCRHVKITKHANTGTNYAILTKRVKVKHEKKPISNLKTMQTSFEKTSTKSIEIFVPWEWFIKEIVVETISWWNHLLLFKI